jgi:hypothetical protein
MTKTTGTSAGNGVVCIEIGGGFWVKAGTPEHHLFEKWRRSTQKPGLWLSVAGLVSALLAVLIGVVFGGWNEATTFWVPPVVTGVAAIVGTTIVGTAGELNQRRCRTRALRTRPYDGISPGGFKRAFPELTPALDAMHNLGPEDRTEMYELLVDYAQADEVLQGLKPTITQTDGVENDDDVNAVRAMSSRAASSKTAILDRANFLVREAAKAASVAGRQVELDEGRVRAAELRRLHEQAGPLAYDSNQSSTSKDADHD